MRTATKQIPTWTIGDRLAKSRRIMGWSQQRMADELGISVRTVSRMEDENGTPKRPVLIAWAELTGVPLDWLTGDTRDETDTGSVTLGKPGSWAWHPSLSQASPPGRPRAA